MSNPYAARAGRISVQLLTELQGGKEFEPFVFSFRCALSDECELIQWAGPVPERSGPVFGSAPITQSAIPGMSPGMIPDLFGGFLEIGSLYREITLLESLAPGRFCFGPESLLGSGLIEMVQVWGRVTRAVFRYATPNI